jgi:hypothetical protein
MTFKINEDTIELIELDHEELDVVCGGTFTPNAFSNTVYHSIGISTKNNCFKKDEFMFMGRSISHETANEIVRLARSVSSVINEGYQGANQIGYSEDAFRNAFNSQMILKFGYVWDGVSGRDL